MVAVGGCCQLQGFVLLEELLEALLELGDLSLVRLLLLREGCREVLRLSLILALGLSEGLGLVGELSRQSLVGQ